jgi:acetyltransferase-like isoleucine patch superfamily enzyme
MKGFILKVRRAETPGYRFLKRAAWFLLTMKAPVPVFLRGFLRALYTIHFGARRISRRVYMFFYGEPLFRSRCDKFGSGCFVWALPEVTGQTRIEIGNDVSLWGDFAVTSGRTSDEPTLVLNDRVQIGNRVSIVVNREVVIEEGAMISNNCYITDSDTHPRDADERAGSRPPADGDIKPVKICRNAWIGVDCTIYKGVTVGEGAIVGTRSVVISNVPPYSIAMGNPARVIASTRAAAERAKCTSQNGMSKSTVTFDVR